MATALRSTAKVHANDAAKAAIMRMYNLRQRSIPNFEIDANLPDTGLLTYNLDPHSYYFDRDANRSFFLCSAKTGEKTPVRLQLCKDAIVIRRLPADGNWY